MSGCEQTQEPRLATVLHRTALEVTHLRQLSLAVESSLAEILVKVDSELSVQDMRVLQDLDLLSQSAETLADFLTKLSEKMPDKLDVDLSEAFGLVKLENIRNRLLGANDLPALSIENPASENIEVF